MPFWIVAGFVVAGAVAGFFQPHALSNSYGQIVLYVFLPPLLFEAAWNLDARQMLANWRPIFALAVPGVCITTVVVAGALFLAGFPLLPALLCGAIVSATDPIAIVAIFRRVRIPAALSTIIESESLLNDAMAVVAYRALLAAAIATLTVGSSLWIAGAAVAGIAGGVLIGAGTALIAAFFLVRRHPALVQIIVTIAGAYTVYLLAEKAHVSGIFAVIAFGIALREAERRALSVQVAGKVGNFWDAGALFANACVFFLTGAAIHLAHVSRQPVAAIAALIGIVLARFVLAYGVAPFAMGKQADRSWLRIIRVAEARGALSLALALALPLSLAWRTDIIDITFAVVLVTLLAAGFNVPRATAQLSEDEAGV